MNLHWRAPARLHTSSLRLPVEGELPSLDGATGWLNSPPLTAAGLRGKVVLTGFWTYTCIKGKGPKCENASQSRRLAIEAAIQL